METAVLCGIDSGIATLKLNRPERLNAINCETADRLMDLLDELETDADLCTMQGFRRFVDTTGLHHSREDAQVRKLRHVAPIECTVLNNSFYSNAPPEVD